MITQKKQRDDGALTFSIHMDEQEALSIMTLDSASLINMAAEIMKVMEQTNDEISNDQEIQ